MSNTTRSRLGSIREVRPGVWKVCVSKGYRADGRQRTVYATVHGTEDDARAKVRELSERIGRNPSYACGVTLADVWRDYKVSKGQRLAKKTLAGYTWYVEHVWLPRLGDVDVTRITRPDVQRVLLQLESHDMADRCRRILSAVLSWAVSVQILDENVVRRGGFELPGDVGSAYEDEDVWDDDPFAAIDAGRDVWDAVTVMEAFPLMRGLPLESAWLAMVGAGLRVEEALALRKMDVRRVLIGGKEVTQLAVHHARTDMDERKRTKTKRSVRIVAVAEPFGMRLWQLADELPKRDDLLCQVSAANQNKRWRGYFAAPLDAESADPDERRRARHVPGDQWTHKGRLHGLPYLPLARMRATHATLMQEAGVLDSINAAVHGHSEQVAYTNYKRADLTAAAEQTGQYLRLVM